tara:strand:- start:279 stop:392 length:114 start_codon:yes stop_codon:yes gene_type:complete
MNTFLRVLLALALVAAIGLASAAIGIAIYAEMSTQTP